MRSTTCMECGGATSNGKPYCEEHILMLPYAARLHREVERRRARVTKVRAEARAIRERAEQARAVKKEDRQRRVLLQSLADAVARAARVLAAPPPPAMAAPSVAPAPPSAAPAVEWSWVPTDLAMDRWGIRCWRCQAVEPVPFVHEKDARDQVAMTWRAHHSCRPGQGPAASSG